MKLSEDLTWRGLIKDKTFESITWLDKPRTFYLGVDCSSDSLAIGNLAVLLLARRLSEAGWKTVLLVGGATSLIGDPGGKDEERPLKSREEIAANVAAIKAQVSQLFAHNDFELVDNYDWFKTIGYLDFLRDVGKHFSMTELVQRDFIATRMHEGGSGISYAEFSYNLIQGYDYWWLFKHNGVVLQIGGSDQWGNMLSGALLIRKKEAAEVHALSMPLVIDKSTGKKFGKSEDGAVWLDPARTSVYTFYQFWLNVDDEGAEDYLKYYTMLARDEIEQVVQEFQTHRAGRLAQKTLAYEVTKIVHGQERADSVKRVSETLFGGGDYRQLQSADIALLAQELPAASAKVGDDLIAALVASGAASSNSDARRSLQEGAVYLNGQQVPPERTLSADDRLDGQHAIIRRGKNSNVILRISA